MDRYRDLYKWMIIPMIFMQLGIFMDYWGHFLGASWSVHVHYWTGTAWYLFLIIQPYYATHGKLPLHRTNGIIGMFLGGAVAFTAISMLYRDLENAEQSAASPENFGPFEPWFFYGVAFVEIVMMTAFAYAIIKSIIHRKELLNHSWWLISTVFIIMMPALGRGVQNVWIMIEGFGPNTHIMAPLYLTTLIILSMLIWAAKRYGRFNHPATYLAIVVNLINCLLEPIGRSEVVQNALTAVIKE